MLKHLFGGRSLADYFSVCPTFHCPPFRKRHPFPPPLWKGQISYRTPADTCGTITSVYRRMSGAVSMGVVVGPGTVLTQDEKHIISKITCYGLFLDEWGYLWRVPANQRRLVSPAGTDDHPVIYVGV